MSFLKYTGKIEYDKGTKNYCFYMEDEKKCFDKLYMNIPKPITDTNFKQVFGKNPEIAKSLINSFLFPKTKKIKRVEYLSGELPGRIGAYPEDVNNKDFELLRVDILCRCILDEDGREEDSEGDSIIIDNRNIDNTYIIDLEMQIGFSIDNTRRFLTYAKKLDLKYKDRIIVLSLVSKGSLKPKKNNSSKISLQEKSLFDYKKTYEYDDFIIYQIDLDYCRKKISSNDEDLWITDEKEKLNNLTKEWLKYLTLSTWCKSFSPNYYALPTVKKEFFKNNNVYEAIAILYNQDDVNYQMDLYDQQLKEERIQKFKEQEKEINDKNKKIKDQEKEIKDKDGENKILKNKIKELEAQLNDKNSSKKKKKKKKKKKRNSKKKRKTPLKNDNSYDRNSNSSDSNSNSSDSNSNSLYDS